MSTSIELGNERLLQLAEILDTADERHRQRGEPAYDQTCYVHPCGTPSCAMGHWAAANPDRWILDVYDGRVFSRLSSDYLLAQCEEFGLSASERAALMPAARGGPATCACPLTGAGCRSVFRYGVARYRDYGPRGVGWEFVPNIPNRQRSRKLHATAESCIPRWCRDAVRSEIMIVGSSSPTETEVQR